MRVRPYILLLPLLSALQVAAADPGSRVEIWKDGMLIERRSIERETDTPKKAMNDKELAMSLCVGGAVESIDRASGTITCQFGEGIGEVTYDVPWLKDAFQLDASRGVQEDVQSMCPEGMAVDRIDDSGVYCVAL